MVLVELIAYLGETRSAPWCCGGVRGMREESTEAVDTCWRARRQCWRSDRLKGWVGSSMDTRRKERNIRERMWKSESVADEGDTTQHDCGWCQSNRSGSSESLGRPCLAGGRESFRRVSEGDRTQLFFWDIYGSRVDCGYEQGEARGRDARRGVGSNSHHPRTWVNPEDHQWGGHTV